MPILCGSFFPFREFRQRYAGADCALYEYLQNMASAAVLHILSAFAATLPYHASDCDAAIDVLPVNVPYSTPSSIM